MKKRLLYMVPVALAAVAVATWLLWPEQKVMVESGTVVMCTQGEMVSDDTREIRVPADEVGKYGVKTEVITCDRHKRLAELREQAAAALAAKDLAAAGAALEEIVKLEPNDRDAAEKLESVRSGKTPSPTPASSGSSGNGSDDPNGKPSPGETPTGPNADLTRYVPDTLKGFVAQGIIADPFLLWRDYLPEKASAVSQIVVMAEQHGSEAEGQAAIDTDVKAYYSTSPADLTVAGKKAYFGTRDDLAVVALTDGTVRVLVEGKATSGKASDLKNTLVQVLEEILK